MAKQAKKTRRRRASSWHPKFLGALITGILLLVLGAVLWQQFASLTFNDQLIRKIPKDSLQAGVARVSELATVPQFSDKVSVYPTEAKALSDAVRAAGITEMELEAAFDDQFAWGRTNHGSIAVFSITSDAQANSLSDKLKAQVENVQPAQVDDLKVTTGTIKGTGSPIVTATSGRELYVASNAELIKAARGETDGFTSLADFTEVSGRLPQAGGGYVFYNTPLLQSTVPSKFSLVGMSWTPKGGEVAINVETAPASPVQTDLPNSDGSLLIPADLATASVSGTDVSKFFRLLEEQRQETDLPKVLSMQNGIVNLNRTLGVDVVNDYLTIANGRWGYGVYPEADGSGTDWLGILEFPSTEVASDKYNSLINTMAAKLTVPVRREVITVLPDGSQSPEVISEGREPVQFSDFSVTAGPGKAVTLPNIGQVHIRQQNKYVLLATTADGIERLEALLQRPRQSIDPNGQLTLRIKLADRTKISGERDVLLDWIMAARPSDGKFVLNAEGILNGGLNFSNAQ